MKGYDFFIAGFQRCGTTSLHYYLSQMSNIEMTNPKEDPFFFKKKKIKKKEKFLYGTSAPHFTIFPETFETIYKTQPDIKIIILYRDPFERIKSACKFYMNKYGISESRFNELTKVNSEKIDVNQITNLDLQIQRIVNTSFYYETLEKITTEYKININNILLININDDNLQQRVLNFIGYKNSEVRDFKNNLPMNSTKSGIFPAFLYKILSFLRSLNGFIPNICLRQFKKCGLFNKLSDYLLFHSNKWHPVNNNEITLNSSLVESLNEDYKFFKRKYIDVESKS